MLQEPSCFKNECFSMKGHHNGRVLPTLVGGGRARPPLYFPRPALRRHLAGVIGRFCDPERYSTLASQLTSRHNAAGVHQLKYSFRRSRPQTVPVWG